MKNIGIMIISFIAALLLIPLIIVKGLGPNTKYENSAVYPEKGQSTSENNLVSREAAISPEQKVNHGIKIKVFVTQNNKIEEMDLEEYLKGVVASEMPAAFEAEALKAQAIAARTYALTRIISYGGKGCSNHQGADVCTDSTHCQGWISKEDAQKSWSASEASKLWQKITDAVDSTKGMILTYDSIPVMYPLYFSTSGGKTENSKDIFSNQYPYLRSVISPNEESAPKFSSKVTFTNDEFIKAFAESQYNIKLDKNKLLSSQVKILDRTEGGSVKSIIIGSKTLTGMDVRRVLNLNSANFNIVFGKSNVTFTVLGYGHGVGMSQWGANVMAKSGKKYDEILKHYYQGVEIDNIANVLASK